MDTEMTDPERRKRAEALVRMAIYEGVLPKMSADLLERTTAVLCTFAAQEAQRTTT